MSRFQVVIGRAERVTLPHIVLNVPAKIDTGAFRSSIHCKSIKLVKSGGKAQLKVELLGHPCSPVVYPITFDEFEEVVVTNSFGHEETRYEVNMRVKLGPKVFNTSFTLADRANNLFPILIGRKFLRNRYIVDVSRSNVDRKKLKKEFGITAPMDEEDMEG